MNKDCLCHIMSLHKRVFSLAVCSTAGCVQHASCVLLAIMFHHLQAQIARHQWQIAGIWPPCHKRDSLEWIPASLVISIIVLNLLLASCICTLSCSITFRHKSQCTNDKLLAFDHLATKETVWRFSLLQLASPSMCSLLASCIMLCSITFRLKCQFTNEELHVSHCVLTQELLFSASLVCRCVQQHSKVASC